MCRRRSLVVLSCGLPRSLFPIVLAALCLLPALLHPQPVAAEPPDPISGLYVSEADPRATVKLLLAPSEKYGVPVGRVWGVVSYKDPRRKADSCMFEFQSTLKGNVLTCRDAMNPGCEIQLRLVEGTVILDTDPRCLTVYCKGQGRVVEGVYVRTAKHGKKSRLP